MGREAVDVLGREKQGKRNAHNHGYYCDLGPRSGQNIEEFEMEKSLKQNQIASAILAQDQLCFSYSRKKEDGSEETVVRFVTPISLTDDIVHCAQHLPEEGFRNFKLDKIQSMQRVISRAFFPNLYQKDQGTDA